MSAKIFIARRDQSENLVHIDDVNKLDNQQFICLGCAASLIAVKSKARKKDWHFRHFLQTDCSGSRDSALHSYAIQIMLDNSSIALPKIGRIIYHNPQREVAILNMRSDVMICNEGGDIHIEIFVTHDLDDTKIEKYQNNNIRCLKIDLSDRRLLNASPQKIRNAVLDEINNKQIIYWDKQEQDRMGKASSSMSFTDIVFIAACILAARWVILKVVALFKR